MPDTALLSCPPTPSRSLILPGIHGLAASVTGLLLAVAAALAPVQAAPCPPSAPPATGTATASADTTGTTQVASRDRGMLWKITRDGRQSWLYGTVHAGRPGWAQPGPVVAQALRGSKVLALELDPLSPTLQAEMAGWMAPPGAARPGEARPGAARPDASQPETLPPALTDRLVRQLQDACLPESLATRLHPMAVVTLAQLALAQRAGLHTEFGIDAALARRARQAGQPIVSMETPDAHMRALFGPRGTVNVPEVDAMLASLERGTDRVSLERLVHDWERGDHADLSAYADWCDCLTTAADRALMKRVLDDRNGALALSVQHLHQTQGPVFAAVGALHMTGPASLLMLLAAQGFQLERVQWPTP